MMYLHNVAAVPNELINDKTMQYTTKKVATVLLMLAGRKNKSITVKFEQLAQLTHYSSTTVQQAIRELINAGYITKSRNYRYSDTMHRLVFTANTYTWHRRIGGYTLVRKEILDYDLTPSAFANLLFLYRCAGREGRAFPSIRRIAGCLKMTQAACLDMAKSTVCIALKALRLMQAVVRRHCKTKKECYSSNSYYLTNVVMSNPAASADRGSPKSDKHSIINQITGGFKKRKEKYCVAQFGRMNNFEGGCALIPEYEYVGEGIKIHPIDDPPELLA